MKILLADDSQLLRRSLTRLLSKTEIPLEVYESDSLFSTIRELEKDDPDLLILDMQMPGGSGLDVLNYMKATGRKVTTIVLTNHCSDFYREKSLALGADYFFDKTKEFEKIVDVLNGTGK